MSVRLRHRAGATLALAAVTAVLASALQGPDQGMAAGSAAIIPVSASLDSCSGSSHGGGRSCEIVVSFRSLADAGSYEVTITAPDGSLLLNSEAVPGNGTYSVPYAGDGTYGVHVTAFAPAP